MLEAACSQPSQSPSERPIKIPSKVRLIILLLWVGQAFADDVDLKKAREFIDGGKSAEAYSMLAPQEELLSGDQDFDYLLALAALDSGQLEKSITIFDRILAVNPKFAGARVDLARAYFALGSLDLARQEFDCLRGGAVDAFLPYSCRYLWFRGTLLGRRDPTRTT